MKPTTLVASMLLASAAAGVTPQISTFLRSALPSQVAAGNLPDQKSPPVQIGWPTNAKPITLHPAGDGYVGYVPVRNTSDQSQLLSGYVRLQGADGAALPATVQLLGPQKIEALGTELETVMITLTEPGKEGEAIDGGVNYISRQLRRLLADLPAVGFLRFDVTSPSPEATSNASVPIAKKYYVYQEVRIPQRPLMGVIFFGSLITTIIVIVITAVNLRRKGVGLFRRMGTANWAFEKSWGANVTLGGALLVTLIGLTVFPDPPHLMTKLSYSLLQILFGALVSMAPLVYNLIRREVQVQVKGNPAIEIQGYVALFIIAGGLVLWAALGQVATLALLMEEFVRGATVDPVAGRTLQGLAFLLFILLLVYGFRSLYATAKGVSAPSSAAGGAGPGFLPPASAEALPVPMSEWSIL